MAPKGYFRSTYDTLTSSENAAVVKSIAAFGVSKQFPSRPRQPPLVPRAWIIRC